MLTKELFSIPNDIENVLIHTDIRRGMKFPINQRDSFLENHYKFIKDFVANRRIFLPAFNYSCLKSGKYSVSDDEVQVGVLNEYIREKKKFSRSLTPVFNFLSNYNYEFTNIQNESIVDPFGNNSTFHFLYTNNSYLLHYGSSLSASTIIHYVERVSNKLVYRYDKNFNIKIINKDEIKNVKFKYHVRPLGLNIEYDWEKLQSDLISENLLDQYRDGRTQIIGIKIDNLVKFWLEKINEDYLYPLNKHTRFRVLKKLEETGGKFEMKNFENNEFN